MNEQAVELLKELAAQLNTTVEFLWEILVKQANVYAITYVVYWVLIPGLVIGAYRLTKFTADNWDENDGRDVALLVLCIILWAAIAILFVNQLLTISLFITALLNPEYWALQQILNQIR